MNDKEYLFFKDYVGLFAKISHLVYLWPVINNYFNYTCSPSPKWFAEITQFPNLISQLFVAVHEINYPSCFIVYYEIKQRRNYSVDHTANPAPPERIRRVSVRAVSSFVDTSENYPKKIRSHDRTKFLPSGWRLDVHGSFHKSLKTHFDWSESLALSCANNSNSVMIGYSGRKLPCKLLTFIYRQEPLPHSSLRSCWIR